MDFATFLRTPILQNTCQQLIGDFVIQSITQVNRIQPSVACHLEISYLIWKQIK